MGDPNFDANRLVGDKLKDISDRLDKIEKRPLQRTWVEIEDVNLSAAIAEIEFANISQRFRHLMIVGALRSARSDATSDQVRMRLNDRGGTVYSSMRYYCRHETTTGEPVWTSAEAIASSYFGIGHVVAELGPADIYSPIEIFIPNYTVTTIDKTFQAKFSFVTADASEGHFVGGSTGMFSDTPTYQAVESIQLWMVNANVQSLSRLTLYGLG